MADSVGLIAEIFTWIGVGFGVVLLLAGLVVRLLDDDWVAARAVVERGDSGHVVRWFGDDGSVDEARISPFDLERLAGRDMADIFYLRGRRHRMRFHRRSHAARFLLRLGLLLLAIGIAAFLVGWIPVMLDV
ncbi:hypothetical protein M4I32_08920 [Microbacterium sp. LRZ72]|uniref:hypothetical protein n=1 Tax=Microbacterium sp. LRZ72 TaxID=2942481 RepID=UPI0029AC9761|nr:hypothetical protein [Microbacterium sp. LRZ72]MDX2376916.1 hypothetical protein [Microbacterium sp. LRZ72]